MVAILPHIRTGGEHDGHYTTYAHWRRALQPLHNRYPLEASMTTITQQISTGGEHGGHFTTYTHWRRA